MKNNLKKIIAGIMAGIICLGMTACGGGGANNSIDTTDWTDEQWYEAAEELKERSSNAYKNNEEVEIKASSEIRSADCYSGKIQLGNTVFTYPISLADLMASESVIYRKKILNPLETVRSKSSLKYDFTIDGIEYTIPFKNKTSRSLPLKDCEIGTPTSGTYICPNGITKGTSIDDLIKAWGEPDEIEDDYIYVYYDKYVSDLEAFGSKQSLSASEYMYRVGTNPKKQTVGWIYSEINPESDKPVERICKETSPDGYNYTYSVPDYLKDEYHLYENKDDSYLIVCPDYSYLKLQNSFEMSGEFTDGAITEAMDDLVESEDLLSYDYKLNKDSCVVIYRSIDDDEATGFINVAYVDSDFKMHITQLIIYPCNGTTEVTEDALKSMDDLMFSIGSTIKPEKK